MSIYWQWLDAVASARTADARCSRVPSTMRSHPKTPPMCVSHEESEGNATTPCRSRGRGRHLALAFVPGCWLEPRASKCGPGLKPSHRSKGDWQADPPKTCTHTHGTPPPVCYDCEHGTPQPPTVATHCVWVVVASSPAKALVPVSHALITNVSQYI